MNHDQKAKFVLAMTKHGLKAMDGGGVVSAGSSGAGLLGGIAGGLTTQNGYQASNPYDPSVLTGAVGNTNQVYGEEQNLAGELGTEAAGGGPNPAQTQYLQNAQTIAQQGATTNANNRALNPALAARLSGNQATAAGQTAAGGAAAQQAQQQINAQGQLGSVLGTAGNQEIQQQNLYNNANATAEGINAQVSQNNANATNSTAGGLVSGAGSAIGTFLNKGGPVKKPVKMAAGGSIQVAGVPSFSNAGSMSSDHSQAAGAGSSVGKFLQSSMGGSGMPTTDIGGSMAGGAADAGGLSSLGPAAMLAAKGGKVNAGAPAQKATVKGNSLKNDKIPALLSEGEEVLPREVMGAKDPVKAAADFVRAEIAKKGLKSMHGLKLHGARA